MPESIIYLLKASVSLSLFYLAYYVALRRLTFYYINRFFLLSGLVFSAIYPMADISSWFSRPESLPAQLVVISSDITLNTIYRPSESFNYWDLVEIGYWAGVGVMTIRLLIQLFSLYAVHRSSAPSSFGTYNFRMIKTETNPFSFLSHIYVNPARHSSQELLPVLQHERVHVRQWHTLDVIFAELCLIFFWFNPFSYLIRHAIKENLEFVTDQSVIKAGINRKEYQYSLVGIARLPATFPVANNFNFSTVKKRIAMMNKKRSSSVQLSRYILVLPLIIVFALVFSVSKAGITTEQLHKMIMQDKVSEPGSTAAAFAKPDQQEAVFQQDSTKNKAGEEQRQHQGLSISGLPDSITYYVDGIKSTKEEVKNLSPDKISSINVLKGKTAGETYPSAEGNNVVAITTKAGKLEGVSIVGYRAGSKDGNTDTARSEGSGDRIIMRGNTNPPLVIVDGKASSLESVPTSSIKSVSVLKGEHATSVYGSRGANGVILVTTNNNAVTESASSDIMSVLDPASLNTSSLEAIKTKFKDKGITMTYSANYAGKKLKELEVSLKSGGHGASANFKLEEMIQNGYLILLKANPLSGDASVVSLKKND